MTIKYVYLYKIIFTKDNNSLFYIGIRVSKVPPEQDVSYEGSPKAFREIWKDTSYIKTKIILKQGLYDIDFESFRDEEPILIKEAWEKDGIYSQGGNCLNGTSGKMIHPSFISGENSPMKRQEVKDKIIQTRRLRYGEKTFSPKTIEKFCNRKATPEEISRRVATFKKNNQDDPERVARRTNSIRNAIGGDKSPNKKPERRKQNSELMKKRIQEGYKMDPQAYIKAGNTNKKRYEDNPQLREEMSIAAKLRFQKDPSIKKRMSDARKKWYAENPEKAKMKNKKAAATRSKNTSLKKKDITSLEKFFND